MQVLSQLIHSPDHNVVHFAALATFHLAAIPDLKEPLGETGAITALVAYARRWVWACALMGVWGLGVPPAAIPGLKEPLGETGTITALVAYARRWVWACALMGVWGLGVPTAAIPDLKEPR